MVGASGQEASSRRREPLTLAVLNGTDQGKVLRTTRLRVNVGTAAENDLVLRDSDVQPHHFSIVVDDGGWRAQTTSPKQQIVIDRRWSHPGTGRRGALIYAGGTEILLFPGDLDDPTIEREIRLRATADMTVPETQESGEVTRVASRPQRFDRDMHTLPPPAEIDHEGQTIPLPSGSPVDAKLDRAAIAAMPTIAGAPIPRAIQEAAQKGMRPEVLTPPPTVSDPSEERGRSVWDRAIGAKNRESPEVAAEPEPRMAAMPGSTSSVVADFSDGTPRAMVRVEPDRGRRTNAWGDSAERTPEPSRKPTNAWGDSAARAPGRTSGSWGDRTPQPPPTNAWGDAAPAPRSNAPVPKRPSIPVPAVASGVEVHGARLAQREDAGLQVLRDPDGDFATQVRVFGTRLQDLTRSHGYRTYMITSPEALTGKTTVAANLALALAEDPRRRVALIEANFRYPRLGEIFGVPERHGLLGVLEGRLQITEAIVKLADRNLVVFPAGGRHAHPAEVLASPRFKTLLAELAATVDLAIVDAPSVRPFADANLILPLVDGALMVVLAQSTRSAWVDQSVDQLGKERVVGAIFNQLDRGSRKALAKERSERAEATRMR